MKRSKNNIMVFVLAVVICSFATIDCSQKKEESKLDQKRVKALDRIRGSIEETVKDRDRKDKALAVVDEVERELDSFNEDYAGYEAEFKKLYGDYDTGRKDLQRVFDKANARRMEFAKTIVALRSKALSHLTPQEWEEISGREKVFFQIMAPATSAGSGSKED